MTLQGNTVGGKKYANRQILYSADLSDMYIQKNFSGSNTFGAMKISSRQGKFELMSVYHSSRSGSI